MRHDLLPEERVVVRFAFHQRNRRINHSDEHSVSPRWCTDLGSAPGGSRTKGPTLSTMLAATYCLDVDPGP